MGLALSTSWNAFRHTSGRKLLFEIRKLGITEVELSFNLTPDMLEDIAKSLKASKMNIVSLHNFCPIPDGLKREEALPDSYSLSSRDEGQRGLAIKYTKRTIETASSLGAEAVVLHCGRVEAPDRTKDLINLFERGLTATKEFRGLKDAAQKERNSLIAEPFDRALNSLEELNRFAEEKNIILGIETRYYLREIPSLEEIGIILNKFKNSRIRYWHDTGHAQVMENLTVNRHKDYLDLYGSAMAGIHLHDLFGCRDHLAPAKGKFDFSRLAPYLKKETIKVIEAHSPGTALDIIKSKKFLETAFDGKI